MRKIAFWDWQYMGLLRFLRETQPENKELYALFNGFRPVDYDTQRSFCVYSSESDTEDFDKLDQDKKNILMQKIGDEYNPELFECPKHLPLIELIQRFSLDEKLVKLIEFFFLYDRYSLFRDFFLKLAESRQLFLMEVFTGLERNTLIEEMKCTGYLAKCGILDEECSPGLKINRYNIVIAMAQYISYYLDDTHTKNLVSFVLNAVDHCDLPLSAFDLEKETILSALTALKKPGPGLLLFYGAPGTGKTELSKRIVLEAGKHPCFLNNEYNHKRNYPTLCIASKLIDPDHDVLIIDEAEALLNTSSWTGDEAKVKQKSLMNQFLDDYPKKMILIVNNTYHISDSTLRRMHVLIGFKPLTCVQRKKIWNHVNATKPVFSSEEQQQLSIDFPANPSRINQVQEICSELSRSGEPTETILATARDMLGRSGELLCGKPYRKKGKNNSIDIDLLNVSVPANELLEKLDRWKDSHDGTGEGLNLLFYGIPGTGKTAFAKYLVQELELPLVLKRASDLLDPYVGGTERKLREAFEEAKDSALVIDEADSFLTDRSAATRSWERTQVNEFLTCMESFTGLFIATTNFTRLLDTACLRRFQLKAEFYAPDADRRIRLAKHFFGAIEWNESAGERLTALTTLTPGDFSAVARRMRYVNDVSVAAICDELEIETGFRTVSQIGFAG